MSLVWIIVLALVLAGVLCLMAGMAYATEVALAHARHAAGERAALASLTNLVVQKLQTIHRDLLYLSRESLLERAINEGTPEAEAALTEEWVAFSRSKT